MLDQKFILYNQWIYPSYMGKWVFFENSQSINVFDPCGLSDFKVDTFYNAMQGCVSFSVKLVFYYQGT
jgi:hypothetical protein